MNKVDNAKSGLSNNWATAIETAGVVVVVMGVAAAIFSRYSTNYLNVDPKYFLYSGIGASGTGILVTSSACACRRGEPGYVVDPNTGQLLWNHTPAPTVEAPKKPALGTGRGEGRASDEPEDDLFYSVPDSDEERASWGDDDLPGWGDDGAAAAPPRAGHAPVPNMGPGQHLIDLARPKPLTPDEAEVFQPRPSIDTYLSIGEGYDDHKGTMGMVAPLCTVKSVFDQVRTYQQTLPQEQYNGDLLARETAKIFEQAEALENYVYQQVKGDGNCFYIALISGLLHRMVAYETFDQTLAQILSRDIADDTQRERVSRYITDIKDAETLIRFLNDDTKVLDFVNYMRKIAYTSCPEAAGRELILRDKEFTDLDQVAPIMVDLFDVDLYITPETPDFFARTAPDAESYDDRNGRRTAGNVAGFMQKPIAIIYRKNMHFDLMINQLLLDNLKPLA